MATMTLAELIAPVEQSTIEDRLKTNMRDGNLPVDAYASSSVPLVLSSGFAKMAADFYLAMNAGANGGLLPLATGEDLRILAFNVYQIEYIPAEFTQGNIVFEDSAGGGPWDIAAGQIWIQAPNGLKFNNIEAGTLLQNGTLELTFRAEFAGTDANAVDSDLTTWVFVASPLPGVSIRNPADPVSGTWITVYGREIESDTSLRERCQNKWPTIGFGMTADAWKHHARKASTSVTKTKILTNPGGVPGLTGIVIAGVNGALDAAVVTTVQDYVEPLATNCTSVLVSSAVPHTVFLTGTIRVKQGNSSLVTTQLAIVTDAVQNRIAIGDTIYISQIVTAIQDISKEIGAVLSVELSSYASIVLVYNEVAILDTTGLSIVEVLS